MKNGMMKKLLTLSIVLAMIFSLTVVGLGPVAAADDDQYTFQILFTSDLHGCFYDWSYSTNANYTGLARVATKINELRDDDTILLDIGDSIQGNGTTIFTSDAWDGMYPVIAGMEYLAYDAWILGNHEFNFGIPALEKAYGKGEGEDGGNLFSGAVLSGNVFDADDNQVFDSYTIIEMPNGLLVAIVGMTTPNIDRWDAANLADAGYYTESATVMTEKTIKYIKDNDLADIIIAAEHMDRAGEYEREGSGAADVLANKYNADNIDLFIGAHGHLNTDVMESGVRFVEVGANGGRLGQVQVTVTKQADGSWAVADKESDTKMTNITLSQYSDNVNFVESDPQYKEALKAAHDFGVANCTTVIGKLIGEPLVPAPALTPTYEGYLQDTALIHLINDAMLYYTNEYAASDEFKADNPEYDGLKVTLSGTAPLDTFANHQPGDITKGSASTIYKYDNNTLYILAMTGAQFKEWMEWAYMFIGPFIANNEYDRGPAMKDGDLTIPYGNGNMAGYNMDQFEGVTYRVDLTQPVGSRIVDLKNKDTGEDFDLEETYLVAVNNYRANTQLTSTTGNPVYGDAAKPVILARDLETKCPGTGEGMLGVMINYIQDVLDGVVDNTDNAFFTPNWSYITPDIDEGLRAVAIEAVNAGQIELFPVNGNAYARRAVKDSEVAWSTAFYDIFPSAWYFGPIGSAVGAGLMNGLSPIRFGPSDSLTREMFVTILYRLAGKPEAEATTFTDVPEGQWYSEAIAWGEAAGIIEGAGDGVFGLGNPVTRQEMVTFLYRYIVSVDAADGTEPGDVDGFRDSDKISDWALEAMEFAIGAKLITGVGDDLLNPGGRSTRAQAATLFIRVADYLDNYVPIDNAA